jgi:hypothetical protein
VGNSLRDQLVAALRLLGMAPELQLEHVRQLGVDVDELGLEFDDVAGTRKKLVADGVLSPTQAAAVAAVDYHLVKMTSAGPARWTDEAVLSGEDWVELRELARSALMALD